MIRVFSRDSTARLLLPDFQPVTDGGDELHVLFLGIRHDNLPIMSMFTSTARGAESGLGIAGVSGSARRTFPTAKRAIMPMKRLAGDGCGREYQEDDKENAQNDSHGDRAPDNIQNL